MISHTYMQRLPVVLKIVFVCNMAPTTTTTTPQNRRHRRSCSSVLLLLLVLLLEGVCLSHAQQQPQQQETNETLCESFSRHSSSSSSDAASEFIDSSSSSSHVFTSPLYPKEYPPNLQCIRVIEAPPGHVIRLSFLESFSIEWESSSCRYDNLEIRDGQFGYSSMIEKLCGDVPPSFIESSGRFLWLRFNSDKDIQYGGFKVQVNFISSSSSSSGSFSSGAATATNALLDTTCSMYLVNLTEGYLRSEDIPGEVLSQRWSLGGVPIDCTWVIEAKEEEKIYLQFFQYALAHPNDCTANFVEVYGGKTELEGEEGRISHFCGSEADSVTSKRNVMHVRFLSGIKVSNSGGGSGADPAGVMKQVVVPDSTLEAYFSVFRDLKEGQSCVKNREFDCTDNTCIDFSLRCNEGKANCKLRNDEEGCDLAKGRFKLTTDILIISFLGILLMAGMCSGLLLNIYRKLREDKLWGHHHDNSHQSSSSSPAGGSSSNKDPEQQAGDLEDHPAAAAGGGKQQLQQRSIQEVLRQPAAHQQHQQQKDEGGSSSSGGGCSSSDGTGTTTVSPPLKKLSSELVRRVEVRDTGCQATPPPPPPGLPAQDAHHHQPGRMSSKTPSLPAGAVVPPSSGGGVVVVVPSSRRKTHADILVID